MSTPPHPHESRYKWGKRATCLPSRRVYGFVGVGGCGYADKYFPPPVQGRRLKIMGYKKKRVHYKLRSSAIEGGPENSQIDGGPENSENQPKSKVGQRQASSYRVQGSGSPHRAKRFGSLARSALDRSREALWIARREALWIARAKRFG